MSNIDASNQLKIVTIISKAMLDELRRRYSGMSIMFAPSRLSDRYNVDYDLGTFVRMLNANLQDKRDQVDAIIMCQSYMNRHFGHRNAMLIELMMMNKPGYELSRDIKTFAIDDDAALNEAGYQQLTEYGIEVSSNFDDLCMDMDRSFGLAGDGDDGDVYSIIDDEPMTQMDMDRRRAFGDVGVPKTRLNPFADELAVKGKSQGASEHDFLFQESATSDAFDDSFDDEDGANAGFSDPGNDAYGNDADNLTSDFFATLRSSSDYESTGSNMVGNIAPSGLFDDLDDGYDDEDDDEDDDEVANVFSSFGSHDDYDDDDGYNDGYGNQDDYDDGFMSINPATRHDGFSGNGTIEDVQKLFAPTYDDPQWDYSEINEGIKESNSGIRKLFGGGNKNGGRIIGEAEHEMEYVNSRYIPERAIESGSGYTAPVDCKVIVSYSPSGGSGKTTIATMIGAQLVWYFDRDLLMMKTQQPRCRVLVLSFNEFDDISLKGVGTVKSLMTNGNRGANVLELKRKIDECNGMPEWDDISHCFQADPHNQVMYLPSMTLAEKFEEHQDITNEDYKSILTVCKRFFNFIIIDTPDVFYDQKNALLQFAFTSADVLCFVINPDEKSLMYMYNLLNGLKASNKNHNIPFDRNMAMMVVNKVMQASNPYVKLTHSKQIGFKEIANTFTEIFYKVIPVPMTDPFMEKNIMFGYDRKVKEAAANLADTVLEIIDLHDHTNGK